MDSANLGDALKEITSEATAAISQAIEDVKENSSSSVSSDLISSLVSSATSGATEKIGEIDIPGFTSDDLSSMVENVTKGATSGLGKMAASTDENIELSSLVSEISSSATESLDQIEMPGFDSEDLSSILEGVAKGASEGLEDIETSNANDKLALLEKIQEGTTEALETIEMDGFDADEQKETLEKKIKKGTSSGFVTLLSQLQVAQITGIRAVDSTLIALQPDKIFKAEEELNIELTFSLPVAFTGGGTSDKPKLLVDGGTNRKLFRENPSLVHYAEWIGAGSNLGQKGTYNLKHYFRYTVKSPRDENGKFIDGDQINDFDLYSNKALILPGNVQIAAMGASSEVIIFTKVGEVEGSLSHNNNLVVDARPSVLQHPEYIDDSGKFSHSTEKDHYKVCLIEEKLCVNNSSLNGLEVTSEKSTGKNQHLKLTNDTRLKFQFISDEPGKYKIKQGVCTSPENATIDAKRGVNEFEWISQQSGVYEGYYLCFEDQSLNLTQIPITSFRIDDVKPVVSNIDFQRGLQSGIRASGENSLNYYVTDLSDLSLSFDATDNNENYISEVHFENCAYKKIQSIESDVVNYEISDFVDLEDEIGRAHV